MQSGKFRHLITIEQPNPIQNPDGQVSQNWAPVAGFEKIFGEVLPDRAQEFFAGRQIQATRNALIRIYYQPGLTENMRVVHYLRPDLVEYWDIAGLVHFQSRQIELRLMCVWREAEGYRRGTDLLNADGIQT